MPYYSAAISQRSTSAGSSQQSVTDQMSQLQLDSKHRTSGNKRKQDYAPEGEGFVLTQTKKDRNPKSAVPQRKSKSHHQQWARNEDAHTSETSDSYDQGRITEQEEPQTDGSYVYVAEERCSDSDQWQGQQVTLHPNQSKKGWKGHPKGNGLLAEVESSPKRKGKSPEHGTHFYKGYPAAAAYIA